MNKQNSFDVGNGDVPAAEPPGSSPATRSKSLLKMMHIVENKRFTVEIDSGRLNITLEFQVNTLVVADLDKLLKI